jgi:hypothetical protein
MTTPNFTVTPENVDYELLLKPSLINARGTKPKNLIALDAELFNNVGMVFTIAVAFPNFN